MSRSRFSRLDKPPLVCNFVCPLYLFVTYCCSLFDKVVKKFALSSRKVDYKAMLHSANGSCNLSRKDVGVSAGNKDVSVTLP